MATRALILGCCLLIHSALSVPLPAVNFNLSVANNDKDSGIDVPLISDGGFIRIGSIASEKGAHLGAAIPALQASRGGNYSALASSVLSSLLATQPMATNTSSPGRGLVPGQSAWTVALYPLLKYFGGTIMSQINGKDKRQFRVYLIYYGQWTSEQKQVLETFVTSLNPGTTPSHENERTVQNWWKIVTKYYHNSDGQNVTKNVRLAGRFDDPGSLFPLGASSLNPLTDADIRTIVAKTIGLKRTSWGKPTPRSAYVVLTDKFVHVNDFCVHACAYHSSFRTQKRTVAYVHVGDPELQCPTYCTYQHFDPAYKPVYGIGVDAATNWMAHELGEVATNPFQARRVTPGYVVENTWLENGDLCEWDFGWYAFAKKKNYGYFNLRGNDGTYYLIQRNFNLGLGLCTIIGRDKIDEQMVPMIQ